MLSSSFLASTLPFNAASSSANFSASLIILSISSGVSLFWSLVIVIFSFDPVPLSSALTTKMPLASISNVTSIWGIPLGGGEDLTLLGRDDGIPGNKLGHNTSDSLDSKSQGVDIKEDEITSVLLA